MPLRCPSCRGDLIWGGGESPLDRREVRCVDCGERFARRVGWSECISLGVTAFIVAAGVVSLLFDWFNPLGLEDEVRRGINGIVLLSALAAACIAVPLLTRKDRRLVPVLELEPAERCAGQRPMKVRCPCCHEQVDLYSQDMKKVSTRHNLPLRFQCPTCHYDLRGIESDKCPACGAEIERRS